MPSIEVRTFRDLGAVVKAVRSARAIRQEDLAESLGFSRDYLRGIEDGKPNLYVARLFRTLNRLGIRVSVTFELPQAGDTTNGDRIDGD
ncbi:MAG TPA: helix-turn-helix domain-containing protein [Microbacteriaceae bacterium]